MTDTTDSLRAVPKDLSEIAKAISLGEVAPEDAKTIRDCASAWRTALARLEAAEREKCPDPDCPRCSFWRDRGPREDTP